MRTMRACSDGVDVSQAVHTERGGKGGQTDIRHTCPLLRSLPVLLPVVLQASAMVSSKNDTGIDVARSNQNIPERYLQVMLLRSSSYSPTPSTPGRSITTGRQVTCPPVSEEEGRRGRTCV
jgi:hypothetical protein